MPAFLNVTNLHFASSSLDTVITSSVSVPVTHSLTAPTSTPAQAETSNNNQMEVSTQINIIFGIFGIVLTVAGVAVVYFG
jgi:hypothetical protein